MRKYIIPAEYTAVDKYSGVVSRMALKVDGSLSRMQTRMRSVSSSADNMARRSAIATAAMVAGAGLILRKTQQFEKNMSDVSTLLDTDVESIDALGDKLLDLSKNTPVSIEDMTSALYDLRSGGIKASEQIDVLTDSSKLAVTGLSTAKEATKLLVGAMNSFEHQGLSSTETANILFKTVKFGINTVADLTQSFGAAVPSVAEVGVTLQDFQAATAALTTTTTPASVAQTQLRSAITALEKPTAQMIAVFEELGVASGKDLIANYDNLGASFEAVNDKATEIGLNLGTVWGRIEARTGVMAILGTRNEHYVKTLAAMNDGVNVLEEGYQKQLKTSSSITQMFSNRLDNLVIKIGQGLIPVTNQYIKDLEPLINRTAAWLTNNKETVASLAKVSTHVIMASAAVSGLSFVYSSGAKAVMLYNSAIMLKGKTLAFAARMQAAWSAAFLANPLGVGLATAVTLAYAVNTLTTVFGKDSVAIRANTRVRERALDKTIDQRVEIKRLFRTLKVTNKESQIHLKALEDLDKIQPGITKKYDLQTGALEDMAKAEAELTKNILKRGRAEARAEVGREMLAKSIRMTVEPGFIESSKFLSMYLGEGNVALEKQVRSQQAAALEAKAFDLLKLGDGTAQETPTEAINPVTQEQFIREQSEKTLTEKLMIEFVNLPDSVRLSGSAANKVAMPSLGTTTN